MKTRGWQKVFSFTFIQHVKAKSFIVGTIIVCLIVALLVAGVNIIPKLIGDGEEITSSGEEGDITSISAVYLLDHAQLLTQEDKDGLTSLGIKLTDSELPESELIDKLAQSTASEALTAIYADELEGRIVGYSIKTYYAPETDGKAVDALISSVSSAVTARNMMDLGVSAEDLAATQRYVNTSKITAGTDEWNVFESMINYFVPIVVSLALFMLIFVYGQTVAQSIATEKTSRVMELLLTSVRPLAVVIGKVLAMGLVSVCQCILIGIVGSITFAATAPFGIGGDIVEMVQTADVQVGQNAEIVEAVTGTLDNFNAFNILMIFVIFILGYMLYALIAALVGASVSRMEDLQQAMQPYSLLGVLGFYLAYFPIMGNMDSLETGAATVNPVQLFSYYFPISSPFALPSALMLGAMSTIQTIIAVLILAAFVVLVAMLVARVYEMIILHNGNLLKFKDILKMAKIKK